MSAVRDLFATDSTGAAVVRTPATAAAARDAGIAQADGNASSEWKAAAEKTLREFLERNATFHVDTFGAFSGWLFARRAFGAVVQCAVRAGWMEPTSEYRPSVSSNNAPKRVFRSLLFRVPQEQTP